MGSWSVSSRNRPPPRPRTAERPVSMRKIDLFLAFWCVVSLAFWFWYSFVTGTIVPFALYYLLWLGIAGTLTWCYRERIQRRLREWDAPELAKFLLLGFGAVLAEEIFAALANHVPEGFSPVVFLARIFQFWALNACTFFGFIVGWYGLNRYFAFSRREVFYLAGIWGLYAEKVLFVLPSNPLFFLFDFSPTILTYGLIITPAVWSQEVRSGGRRLYPILKYAITYGIIFLCSVPAIVLLQALRQRLPMVFPPASLVPP